MKDAAKSPEKCSVEAPKLSRIRDEYHCNVPLIIRPLSVIKELIIFST
jgi:hypothetical protein